MMSTQLGVMRSKSSSSVVARWMRPFMASASFTLFALMILTAYLSPFGYMVVTGFKGKDTLSKADAPLWPAKEATFTFEGKEYAIYLVPTEEGRVHKWALFKKGREESLFLDPKNPEAGPIQWAGRWRTLEQVWKFSLRWENFTRAWEELRMPLLLRNTFVIAAAGSIGTTLSCVAVAYGFSRFRIPGKSALFTILVATIILQVCHIGADLCPVSPHRMGWHVAAVDRAALFCQRFQCVLTAPVLHDHPSRPG